MRSDCAHFLDVPTRWHDNDVYGHVNNVDYYAFFDTVINRWLVEEGGLDIHEGEAIGLCAESHCKFPRRRLVSGHRRGGPSRRRTRRCESTPTCRTRSRRCSGCAVLTGVGAALNSAQVTPMDSVAVFGLGGVGLAALLGALVSGAAMVVAVDRVPEKLELARELGATHAIAAGDDAVAAIRDATGGGADKVIDTFGSAKVLADAYAATKRGGTTVTVGLPHPEQLLQIQAVGLVAEERTLKGSYLGSCVPRRDIPRFIELYQAGRLPVDRLLPHRIALDSLNEGFDRLARGEGVRQAVVF
jgi:Zn-dependent alcohol dehydrogenase